MDTTMEEEHERAAKEGTLGQFPVDKLLSKFARDRVERAARVAEEQTSSAGSRATPTVPMPSNAESTLAGSRLTYETGQPTRRPPSEPSQALVPSGRDGAVARPIDLAPVREAFRSQDSDRIESALYRSLKPLAKSCLRYAVDGNFELVAWERTGPIDEAMRADLERLADAITIPAGEETVAKLAHRCLLGTKSREHDIMDIKGMVALFCDDLAEFPADVVQTAFRKWARREKWWPSLSEIREECHRANRWRQSFRKAVSR